MLKLEWQSIDRILRKEFPEDCELWLDYVKFLSASDKEIFVAVPNQAYKDRVQEKYLSKIHNFMLDHLGKIVDLNIMIEEEEQDEEIEIVIQPTKTLETKPTQTFDFSQKGTRVFSLDPKHTFEQFIVGNNNLLPHAAARRIAEVPGQNYNPFFLYGGVGLGKTHLMQAIGHYIYQFSPEKKVIYVTSEQFTIDYVTSLQKGRVHDFRLRYRNVDVLLIDDIQFLEGKDGIQEELFHTFNILKESGKQMVFTSDRPPKTLKTMDRLVSRFASGLVADIKPPDLETRQAIIGKKMLSNHIHLSNEIVEFLAVNITDNVRDLEAAVIKLKSIVDLLNETLTLELVEKELGDILNGHSVKKNISVELIQKEVANYYNISYSDIKSKKRTDNISKPRQIAVYLTKHLTHLSTTEIGNEFGGRNHSTIVSAYQKIEKEYQGNESIRNDIDHLKIKIIRS